MFYCQNRSMKTKSIFDSRYKAFISDIVKLRHKKGLSQAGLAKKMGVSDSYIAKIEICERRLDALETADMLKAMGASRSEIMKIFEKLV